MGEASAEPTVRLRGASLGYGARLLWQNLDLTVAPGEFVAVLDVGDAQTPAVAVAYVIADLFAQLIRLPPQ